MKPTVVLTAMLSVSLLLVNCNKHGDAGSSNRQSSDSIPASEFDIYGGWKAVKGKKTGFFHTEYINNRWWLVTPQGNGFFCKGMGGVGWWQEAPKADDPNPWPQAHIRLLKELHFNTIALANSMAESQGLPYAPMLDLATWQRNGLWESGEMLDYFSAEFAEKAEQQAARIIPKYVNDPWMVGYFTDNELHWSPDWRSGDDILHSYLKMPKTSPGYQKVMELLKSHHVNLENGIPDEYLHTFAEMVANQYAKVCSEAIRRYDKNHLIIGCRFHTWEWYQRWPESKALLKGVAPYFDVISCNNYMATVPVEVFQGITAVTGKPLMITEFGFRGADSGLPNTRGAGIIVSTQKERAERYSAYVHTLASLPGCVGFYWFMFRDQRKDSPAENSNYGIVDINFVPYKIVTQTMKNVNAGLEREVAGSVVTTSAATAISK